MTDEPNQKNAHIEDSKVVQLENAAKEVVSGKFYRRGSEVIESCLAGHSSTVESSKWSVTVRTNTGVSGVGEIVDTEIGIGRINSVYATDDDTVRLGVEFRESDIEFED